MGLTMITSDSSATKPASASIPPQLAKEIEQALEMMRRVRIADLAQGKGEAVELPRTKYVVPKPLVYPVSRSRDRE